MPTSPDAVVVHSHYTSRERSEDSSGRKERFVRLPFARLAVVSARRLGHLAFPAVSLPGLLVDSVFTLLG
jgi:hypothetical protein